MFDYERASEAFIEQTINKELYDRIYVPCFNLSCILSDVDGRISTGLLTQVLTGLEIVSPGVLVLGEVGEEVPDMLADGSYAAETSQAAYNTYLALKSSSEDLVVYLDEYSDVHPNSFLLSLAENQSPPIRNALNTLYIECLALYRELLTVSLTNLLTITQQDILRVLSNIRWVSSKLEKLELIPYDLLEVVRDVQVTLFYVLSLDEIFNTVRTELMKNLSDLTDNVSSQADQYTTFEYTVQSGDNIHSIAQRTLGSADRASEIIVFNNLEYPFITSDPNTVKEGVKSVGDVLLIPVFYTPSEVNRGLHLGVDFLIANRDMSGGELVEDVYGDLQMVEGIDCLIQDLKTRLTVEVGSLVFHPEFGNSLHKVIGSGGGSAVTEQKARIEVSKMFLSDSRIQDIVSLTVTQVSDALYIDALLSVNDFDEPLEFKTTIAKMGVMQRGTTN